MKKVDEKFNVTKRNFFQFVMMLTVLLIGLAGCKKNDPTTTTTDPGTSGYFGVKKATIVYDFMGLSTLTVYFDNNGKQFREDDVYGVDYMDDEAWILDETANKAYYLNLTQKTYSVATVADVQSTNRSMFLFTESDYTGTGITKGTETVAGKNCTKYTATSQGMTVTVSGWSGILFHSTLDGEDLFKAKSYNETIPANIFTVPSDFTKE